MTPCREGSSFFEESQGTCKEDVETEVSKKWGKKQDWKRREKRSDRLT